MTNKILISVFIALMAITLLFGFPVEKNVSSQNQKQQVNSESNTLQQQEHSTITVIQENKQKESVNKFTRALETLNDPVPSDSRDYLEGLLEKSTKILNEYKTKYNLNDEDIDRITEDFKKNNPEQYNMMRGIVPVPDKNIDIENQDTINEKDDDMTYSDRLLLLLDEYKNKNK